jgi:tetratricopeptide (TPR) repeat protein
MASLVLLMPANAENPPLESLLDAARSAMDSQEWTLALDLCTQAVGTAGVEDPLRTYGPQFGGVYYRKGICEMKLKQWEEAMKSFEICYRDFRNDPSSGGGNEFEKLALLKWGEAAMAAEQWELALSQFKKFTEERDKTRDLFPQGAFHINSAICHYRTGSIAEGNEHLEIAMKNQRNFPTPDAGIVAGFQALATAAMARRDEQVLMDFIRKNRGELMMEPYRQCRYSAAFMQLAGDALAAEMPRVAEALYHFIPALDVAIDDTKARLLSLGTADEITDGGTRLTQQELEQSLAALEIQKRGKNPPESVKLAAVAYLHETTGNLGGAHAAYWQLEAFHPQSGNRENHLHQLVRTSARIGSVAHTLEFGSKFLRDFPQSAKIPEVGLWMQSSAFANNRWRECIATGESLSKKIPPGLPESDPCLHMLGVSYFHETKYTQAKATLDRHRELHPNSASAVSAAYFQAAATARLGLGREAADLLDQFATRYPNAKTNPLLADANYERAACHLAAGDARAALELAARILSEHPSSRIIGRTHQLIGRAHQSAGNSAAAVTAYEKALEFTNKHPDPALAEDALSSLVVLLAEEAKSTKRVTKLADQYWQISRPGSPGREKVAWSQISALEKIGRGDEGLDRLREIIAEIVKSGNSEDAAGLIAAHTRAYMKNHTPEELKACYQNFAEIPPENRLGRALLQIEVIGAFEKAAREASDEAARKAASLEVKSLFQQFRNDFQIEELPNSLLLRMGDHLRLNTSVPREALACYDELIRRDDKRDRLSALLGRGDVYARFAIAGEDDLALADFNKVYLESDGAGQRDYALFRMIGLTVSKGAYTEAAELAGTYLQAEKGYDAFIPQVRLLLAKCQQELKLNDDAIATYQDVWGSHSHEVEVSAPAMAGWMKLVWARNRKGDKENPPDRELVVQQAGRFLESTRHPRIEEEIPARAEVTELLADYQKKSTLPPGARNSE